MGMTKTSKVEAKILQTTKDGKPAIRISCGCATHPANASEAVLTGATAEALSKRTGKNRDERIHGFVTMANHPARMIRISNERSGIYAA
jgi:hypothetical protein